jgi:acyl dehydratase
MRIHPGAELPPWTLPHGVDAGRIARLAGLLGDPNPLHLDPTAARAAGYPDLLNQGPSNLAMLADLLLGAFPGWRVRHLRARLVGAVVAGRAVRATGTVTAVDDRDGERRVTCALRLALVDGPTVLTGEGTVAGPAGPATERSVTNHQGESPCATR